VIATARAMMSCSSPMRAPLIVGARVDVDRRRHAAHEEVRVRVLAAEDRLQAHRVALPLERLEVVRHADEVHRGRQLVGRVPPVAVGEDAQLSRAHVLLQAILHRLEVCRIAGGPRRDRLGDLRRLVRVGLEGAHHVHPVERVEVVEVHHVVVHELHAEHEVADDVRAGRDLDVQRVLDGPAARDRMHRGAHAADALGECPAVARVAALQHQLQPAERGGGGPRLLDAAIVGRHFDAEVSLDPGDRVDDDLLPSHDASRLHVGRCRGVR
jgi:hypothetical protein